MTQPANMFVAGFIGEPPTNFLDADVSEDENGTIAAEIDGSEPRSYQRRYDRAAASVRQRPQIA